MHKFHATILSAIFAVITAVSPFAQETDDNELEELDLKDLTELKINLSSSKAKVIFKTPSTVSVITKEQIQAYNLKTVTEALNLAAGFAVYPTYHKRDLPSGRGILQNQYSNKVLLLINGIPTWHAITGEANFERIDINTVERIEILKGPASVLYGSNAYSGAVNIVLKSSLDKAGDILMSAGNGNALHYSGSMAGTADDFRFYIGGGVNDDQGVDFKWTDKIGEEGYLKPFYKAANLTAQMAFFKNHTLFANVTSSSQAFLGSDPQFKSGAGEAHLTNGYLFNYTFSKNLSDFSTLKAGATYDWNEVNFYLEPFSLFANSPADLRGDALRMNWRGTRYSGFTSTDFQFGKNVNLEVGIDADYRISSDSTTTGLYLVQSKRDVDDFGLADKTVYEVSAYSQLELDFKYASLLIGDRLTKNEFFGINSSLRTTCNITFTQSNSLKLIYAQSYRSPSFLEIHILSHDAARQQRSET